MRAITVRPSVIVTAMWQVLELMHTAGSPPTPVAETNALRPGDPDVRADRGRARRGQHLAACEPSAWTANTGSPVDAAIPVSNPPLPAVISVDSEPGFGPASTRHDDTVVAPFQLAHTSVVPSLLGAAAMLGAVFGCPVQSILYAR